MNPHTRKRLMILYMNRIISFKPPEKMIAPFLFKKYAIQIKNLFLINLINVADHFWTDIEIGKTTKYLII